MDDQKKMAAAIGAVIAYIKSEEEAVCLQAAAAAGASAVAKAPAPVLNLWGGSGRQAMMQMRNLMQMKTFHRAKFN